MKKRIEKETCLFTTVRAMEDGLIHNVSKLYQDGEDDNEHYDQR